MIVKIHTSSTPAPFLFRNRSEMFVIFTTEWLAIVCRHHGSHLAKQASKNAGDDRRYQRPTSCRKKVQTHEAHCSCTRLKLCVSYVSKLSAGAYRAPHAKDASRASFISVKIKQKSFAQGKDSVMTCTGHRHKRVHPRRESESEHIQLPKKLVSFRASLTRVNTSTDSHQIGAKEYGST